MASVSGVPVEQPTAADAAKPTPQERVQKLRLGVRVVWWGSLSLAVVFAGLALWLGLAKRDPFALLFVVLAVCCALAGYGTLIAVRRPRAS